MTSQPIEVTEIKRELENACHTMRVLLQDIDDRLTQQEYIRDIIKDIDSLYFLISKVDDLADRIPA